MKRQRLTLLILLPTYLLAGVVILNGCHRAADAHTDHDHDHHGHDHHDHEDHGKDGHDDHSHDEEPFDESKVITPARYSDAVQVIAQGCHAIATSITAKQINVAHAELDKTDLHLRRLMPITRDSGVPRRHWEAINLAAKQVRLELNEIHEALDHDQDPKLAEHQPAITASLQELQKHAALATPPPSSPKP